MTTPATRDTHSPQRETGSERLIRRVVYAAFLMLCGLFAVSILAVIAEFFWR